MMCSCNFLYFLPVQIHALCIGNGSLYSGGSDKSIRIWNLNTFENLLTLEVSVHFLILLKIAYSLP